MCSLGPTSGCRLDSRVVVFKVLGPIEVFEGRRLIEVGPRMPRAILAILLLNANRVVSLERLIDLLWDDEPPGTARGSVQAYVSNLRRVLEPNRPARSPPQVLITQPPGYLLRVPADAIDAVRFEALVSEGRNLLAEGRPQPAGETLRRALNLWRGAPFADLAFERFLQPEIVRLGELHATATEAAVEAELALGRHASVVADLERLVTAEPLREQRWGLLALALYRCGRQAEGLRVLAEARGTLNEELGLDPGPALRQLEDEILNQAPSLDWRPPAEERPPQTAATATTATAAPSAPPSNVPTELTSFVGRQDELSAVEALVGSCRLVTLTGPGGVGKTRLAVEAARRVADSFRDGVWLVELAPLTDDGLLAATVLGALRLTEEPGVAPVDSLVARLVTSQMLIVLDNCEHLTAACAVLAGRLLRVCPDVRILATSREPLGVTGERVWAVPALALPDGGPATSADSLRAVDSARLFLERAAAVSPGCVLDERSAEAVAEICRQLDGLPLAIELAAARTRSLSPREIADRLEDRFRFLVGRDPSAPARHRTLRAAVDWSYEALDPARQRLFCRLSVFAGGFTLEAAEAVCGDGLDVLDTTTDLVDRSLVALDRSSPRSRYRLLETLRQFAAERLEESGDRSRWRDRHLDWATKLAEEAGSGLDATDQVSWLGVLDEEDANLRVALDWALTSPARKTEAGLRLAAALWRFWEIRSRYDEGRRWLLSLLDVSDDAAAALRAKAMNAAAILALRAHDYATASELYDSSLDIRRDLGDHRGMASALLGLGNVFFQQGKLDRARGCFQETLSIGQALGERRLIAASLGNLASTYQRAYMMGTDDPGVLSHARALHEESADLWREVGDDYARTRVLEDLAIIAMTMGDDVAARSLVEERMATSRELGDRHGIGSSLQQLAQLALRSGDDTEAITLYEEALKIARELGDVPELVRVLYQMADARCIRGDDHRARRLYEEALRIARQLPDRTLTLLPLIGIGALAIAAGDLDGARRRFDEVGAIARETQRPRDRMFWLAWSAALAHAEGRSSEAEALAVDALGAAPPRKPSRAHAVAYDVLAELALRAGDAARAARLTGAADAFLPKEDRFARLRRAERFQQTVATLREALGDLEFDALRAEGQRLSVSDAVALAAAVPQLRG
jgi:predicted ATPase/DNA-binding SARP family transcriptional activator